MTFEEGLVEHYGALSAKLKEAADFVVSNPVEIATRSLRSVSLEADLAPVSFTRMARAVGYETYEELREEMRNSISRKNDSFSDNVARLQTTHANGKSNFTSEHMSDCINNLQLMASNINSKELEHVANQLDKSKKVLILGVLGSTGFAEYMSYMANFITDNWHLAGRMGASLSSNLVGLNEQDALVVITKAPYATKAIKAAEAASAQGVFVVIITDSHKCPALAHATAKFILPSDGLNFFSSYVPTIALIEALIGMLAVKKGKPAQERIRSIEESNRRLEYISVD